MFVEICRTTDEPFICMTTKDEPYICMTTKVGS